VFVYNISGQLLAEYSDSAPAPTGGTSYIAADYLGTPRAIMASNGSISRHDYQPFGELIPASAGRSGISGYPATDNLRQQFTLKERDVETGLDYFGARYYASTYGRFTGVDNPGFSKGTDPQTWNLYAYTANNPLRRIDPDGDDWFQIGTGYGARFEWHEGKEYKYTDDKGNEQTATNVGTHLVVFEITGTNSDEAVVGTLTLYEQNKVVAQNTNAFSGGDDSWLPTGNYSTIPVGVYTISTGDRSVAKSWSDLKNVYGLQEIDNKGIQQPWGTKRARLNEWNQDLPIEYRGNFIHGRKKDGDYTAGCICDRGETVLDALFKINSKVTPKVKAVVTSGAPKAGDKTPGPYVIKP
ncbi:MAG TPA: RHS repeat-associated core domain-containing protein, partial [Anaerolineales bacterium]|nr:RHS repeat-associated core domain-containing protein [Anaerolineales bacterium]